MTEAETQAWLAAMEVIADERAAKSLRVTQAAYRAALKRALVKLEKVVGPGASSSKIPRGARLARWKKTKP
jgi:hypothetical protein